MSRNIPNKEQIEAAGKRLARILYDGTDDEDMADWLREHFLNKFFPNVEAMIAGDDAKDGSIATLIDNEKLPARIVQLLGTEVFQGKHGALLRDKILDKLFEQKDFKSIRKIYQSTKKSDEDANAVPEATEENAEIWMKKLQDHRSTPWHPGSTYAIRFVNQIKVDPIFAGIKGSPRESRVEEISPNVELKPLKDFQENMKEQVLDILNGTAKRTRAILTLPTGAGKTRTTVEGIIKFLNEKGEGKKILWLADSEELCEQAVQCFKQVWEQMGKTGVMNIFRIWNTRDIPSSEETGIIVAGYAKLRSAVSNDPTALHGITHNLGGVFIDEAHGSFTNEMREILNGLKISRIRTEGMEDENDCIPIIGLTATPERSEVGGTKNLLKMYENEKIFSRGKGFPEKTWGDLVKMRDHMIKKKYLSIPKFKEIEIEHVTRLTQKQEKEYLKASFHFDMLTKVHERNNKIKNTIINLVNQKPKKKVLYFGSTKSQAVGMSRILEANGINSVTITSDTNTSARREYIKIFNDKKSNEIEVMCNYNVLSTGFDSPKIDTILIARPTSLISYQQMVGRGLRGTEFGGTSECLIITVRENIRKHNGKRAIFGNEDYQREIMNDHRPRPLYRSRRDH